MPDQASGLRRAMDGAPPPVTVPACSRIGPVVAPQAPTPRLRLARALAVTSGKGGVGKTNIAVNLAVALSGAGLRVCLLDGDLGLANADVLCNLAPRLTLEHVVAGRCRLAEAALLAPGGFRLLPGASGVEKLADLDAPRREALLRQLAALEAVADVILIDTGAGLGANVLGLACSAHAVLLVITPEPTALTDGYAMVKSLTARDRSLPVHVVVNMASSQAEAQATFERLSRVARAFLGRDLVFAGAVPADRAVPEAVRARLPATLHAPHAPASIALRRMAAELVGIRATCEARAGAAGHGFFSRLAAWLGSGPALRGERRVCAGASHAMPVRRSSGTGERMQELFAGRLMSLAPGVDRG